MQTSRSTPATEFYNVFPEIQVRLHPERIAPRHTRILHRDISSTEELGELFSGFRATKQRVLVKLGHPLSYPMRIKELVARMENTPLRFRARFESMRDHYQHHGVPEVVEIPAYGLGGGEYFLLDGNHRATGLYLAGLPFKLRLRVLGAPVDRRFLIDLKYWDGGLQRFVKRIQRRSDLRARD
jgi:hypothetical protein